MFKLNFERENYLTNLPPALCIPLCKFRCRNHRLLVEKIRPNLDDRIIFGVCPNILISQRNFKLIIFGLCPNILISQRNFNFIIFDTFFVRRYFSLIFYPIIMKFGHHIPRVVCYKFSKTSIVFFRINPRIFWITILLNGKRQFLLTCKMSRYRTMLFLKCKRQYLLTCKVSRYCLLACTAVVFNWVHCWFNVG